MFQCGAYQPFGTFSGHRLNTDTRRFRKTDLFILLRKIVLEKLKKFFVVVCPFLKFYPCINVLGILPEDDHIRLVWFFYR